MAEGHKTHLVEGIWGTFLFASELNRRFNVVNYFICKVVAYW